MIALNDVSMTVESGNVFSILGPNGSGKTTLMRIILDLIRPTSGSVVFTGVSPQVGYMPELTSIPNEYSGKMILESISPFLGSGSHTKNPLIDLMDMGNHLTKKVKTYSKGMVKKLGLIIAFEHEPDLVILDEPFEAIDTIDRDRLNAFISDYTASGKTVILSSHILHDLDAITHQVSFLKKGSLLVSFSPAEVEGHKSIPNSQGLSVNLGHTTLTNPTITDVYRELYK